MRRISWAVAAAMLAVPSGGGAVAQQAGRTPGLKTIQIECMKQQGAYYDASGKKWIIPPAPPYIMSSRIDAVYTYVTQRTGKRAQPFMQEKIIYH